MGTGSITVTTPALNQRKRQKKKKKEASDLSHDPWRRTDNRSYLTQQVDAADSSVRRRPDPKDLMYRSAGAFKKTNKQKKKSMGFSRMIRIHVDNKLSEV